MVANVESKGYVTAIVTKPPARPQRHVGAPAPETSESAARAFIETLPKDAREGIALTRREDQRRERFDETRQTQQDAFAEKVLDEAVSSEFSPQLTDAPVYSSPSLTPSAALLQAQISLNEPDEEGTDTVSAHVFQEINAAYISAGAQAGGEAAAFAATIAKAELAQTVKIIPPIPTRIDFLS